MFATINATSKSQNRLSSLQFLFLLLSTFVSGRQSWLKANVLQQNITPEDNSWGEALQMLTVCKNVILQFHTRMQRTADGKNQCLHRQ